MPPIDTPTRCAVDAERIDQADRVLAMSINFRGLQPVSSEPAGLKTILHGVSALPAVIREDFADVAGLFKKTNDTDSFDGQCSASISAHLVWRINRRRMITQEVALFYPAPCGFH